MMKRFNVDDSQQAVRDRVHAFGEKEISKIFIELDRRPEPQVFPKDYYKKIAAQGFIGYSMPKEYGGGGCTALEYATMIEELAFWDAPTSLLTAVPQLASYPVFTFGNEEQKKKYIPKAAKGELIPAFALTEENAGSDAANQSTTAIENGNNYVINGKKHFIMHGDVCDFAVLFCKIGDQKEAKRPSISAILVDASTPGFKGETLQYKMGMKAATTGRIYLKDVTVPKSNLMGEEGSGFKYAMNTLDGARVGVAAQGVGIAQRAVEEAVKFANKRIAFGAPIAKLQAIQWMIADMATKLEAARVMTYKAAQLQDKGVRFSTEAAQAKLFAAEAAGFCVDRAMQIHSGYGYIGEFSIIEKLYRDQRVIEIYEGTSEVQRLIIGGTYLRAL
ncbi:MAG: acyl-CoA dehydrogenase family protein [Candidatus Zixiibacteriota bacterium]